MAKRPRIPVFQGQDKIYYDRLMALRELVSGQMQAHADNALDCSDQQKRGTSTHLADNCSDNARNEMELQLLSEDGNVLELIEKAIARLADGTYGLCEKCGRRIAEARLEARPHAQYCIQCKSEIEKAQRDR